MNELLLSQLQYEYLLKLGSKIKTACHAYLILII